MVGSFQKELFLASLLKSVECRPGAILKREFEIKVNRKNTEIKNGDRSLRILFKDLDGALINGSFIIGFFSYTSQEMAIFNVLYEFTFLFCCNPQILCIYLILRAKEKSA